MSRRQRFGLAERYFKLRRFAMEVAIDRFEQVLRPFPRFDYHLRNLAIERVAVTTPEVGAGLVTQLGFVFNQLLFKQHAGLKGVQAQHPLAETVNGKDGGIVHLTLRQQQHVGGLLKVVNFRQQAGIERVVGGVTQAGDAQLVNVATNTSAKLFGGGFGEGHHQQLFDVNGPRIGGLATQPQQQPQVECGYGEGFSSARRGFNQALTNQGQAQGIKGLGGSGHSFSLRIGKVCCSSVMLCHTFQPSGCA